MNVGADDTTKTASRRVVCICGPMRFADDMLAAYSHESLAGHIVLLPVLNLEPSQIVEQTKDELVALHRDKILAADEVLVVTRNGYEGESTAAEIAFAREHDRPVRHHSSEPTLNGGNA